eukprot:UN09044
MCYELFLEFVMITLEKTAYSMQKYQFIGQEYIEKQSH